MSNKEYIGNALQDQTLGQKFWELSLTLGGIAEEFSDDAEFEVCPVVWQDLCEDWAVVSKAIKQRASEFQEYVPNERLWRDSVFIVDDLAKLIGRQPNAKSRAIRAATLSETLFNKLVEIGK